MRIERTDKGAVIYKEAGKPLRILQLTDIHLGCGPFCRRNDKLALAAVEKVIDAAKADFCVLTGDLCYPFMMLGGSHNNLKPFRIISEIFERKALPWCMVFGNHDTESFAKYGKEQLGDYLEAQPNCYFAKGDPSITGVGNYCIPLRGEDGKLIYALMFVDSNAYVTKNFFSGFDVIHQDQVDWYKNTIKAMAIEEGAEVKSLAFYHIPPKEIKTAWEHVYRGEKEAATYHLGFVQEKDNYFGYPKTIEGTFFREMVELGSCKGMFFGHDHLNTLSVTYQGIRLTYGMSIDYFAYPHMLEKHTQRGGTVIDIANDGSFEISLLPLDDLK